MKLEATADACNTAYVGGITCTPTVQGMRALTKALAAGAWPHMPAHPRRDPRGEAGEGRLRAGFGVPPLDDEGLRDELLVALDARQQAAVARQQAAAI